MVDRNFDDIADKFTQNIYGTTKGKIREAVIWQDLNSLLDLLPSKPLKILDAGGGEGLLLASWLRWDIKLSFVIYLQRWLNAPDCWLKKKK